jgi:hypothetical protein
VPLPVCGGCTTHIPVRAVPRPKGENIVRPGVGFTVALPGVLLVPEPQVSNLYPCRRGVLVTGGEPRAKDRRPPPSCVI